MSREHSKADRSQNGIIYLKGAVIGVLITAGFLLVFAAAMLLLEANRSLAAPFATVSIAAGTLSAAFYAARKIGDRGYLIGLIMGLIVFAVVTVISLILCHDGLTYNTLFHLIIIMLAGVIGGIWGVNRRNNRKYI